MKALIIIFGVGLGTLLGYFPALNKPKPLWWKFLAFLLISLTIIFSLLPPIAGNFVDARFLGLLGSEKPIDIKIVLDDFSSSFESEKNQWVLTDRTTESDQPINLVIPGKELPPEFKTADELVIKTKYNKNEKTFFYYSTSYINPLLTLPYVPDLEERIRILNFHVPMSWIGVLAFLLSMIYSVMYLKTRNLKYDNYTSSAAALGTIFTILATVTGAVWAKFNWGAYWNWDPRQTSIFVLLLIYFAFFALRSAIENRELKARLSSVYSIIAFATVPFFVFILPRITSGLHPGSADDNTMGPILSSGSDTLNINKQIIFSLSLAAFTMIFFWMFNIYNRLKTIRDKYD